jgi:hypothetical protein
MDKNYNDGLGTCVATQVSLFLGEFQGMYMLSNPHFRGKKRSFDGTENPCVAGSIPALPNRFDFVSFFSIGDLGLRPAFRRGGFISAKYALNYSCWRWASRTFFDKGMTLQIGSACGWFQFNSQM